MPNCRAAALALALPTPPELAARDFDDVTAAAGVRFVHEQGLRPTALPDTMGPGVAFRDFDGDGQPDLVFVQGAGRGGAIPPFVYLRNEGGGRFTDRTRAAGLDVTGCGMGVLAADLDSDGDADLVFSFFGRDAAGRENCGDGTFRPFALPGRTSETLTWNTGMAALDSRGTGRLDVLLLGYLEMPAQPTRGPLVDIRGSRQPAAFSPLLFARQPSRFLAQEGPLAFADRTAWAGLANDQGKGLVALVTDANSDGRPDLFVANDVTPCALFVNDGNGRFRDASRAARVGDVAGSMGLASADYDHDGAVDVFCSRWVGEPHALYHRIDTRPGRPVFVDVAGAVGLDALGAAQVGWGAAFLDADADGWEDLFVIGGHTWLDARQDAVIPLAPVLMRSRAGRAYERVVAAGHDDPLDVPLTGRGAAFADFDGDLAVDVAIAQNRGAARLWRGRAPRSRIVALELTGTRANRDAIGARVEVTAPGLRQLRELTSGDSYLSSSTPRLTFTSPAGHPVHATVRWPHGAISHHGPLEAGRVHRLIEP